MGAPDGMWECSMCGEYVENGKQSCPQCGIAQKRKSDSVRSPFVACTDEKEASVIGLQGDEYQIEPIVQYTGSFATVAMRIFTWIMWFVGAICVIISAFGADSFENALLYLFTGVVMRCMAELFENIQTIANSARGMRIKKIK